MKTGLSPIVVILAVLEILLSLGALYGGATLIAAPDGSLLGVEATVLAGSPFDTYLVPGILLFLFVGVGPLVLAIAALWRQPWTRTLHLVLGLGLVVFEIVEYFMIGYHFLQAIYGIYGLVLAALGLVVVFAGRAGSTTSGTTL